MIDSNTLAAINDIGLMSFLMDTGGFLFGNGITFAVFHSIGTTPSLYNGELLNTGRITRLRSGSLQYNYIY